MAIEDMLTLLSKCARNPGATKSEIASLEKWAGVQMPKPYLDLLGRTNGIEGFVGDDAYLVLWSAARLPELNKGYLVDEFAPGLILIGSDGGNAGYCLDSRRSPMSVQDVPFVGISLESAEEVGADFEDFLRRLAFGYVN